MNTVQLVGRLTADPQIRYSAGENSAAVCRFSVAVQRRFKNAEGVYEADFPNCVAFRQTAEFVEKYFHKGDMIGLTGHVQTGKYTNKDGNTVYTTDIMVDNVEFVGSKASGADGNAQAPAAKQTRDDSFMNIPDNDGNEELPW